ncbi:MAG: hypothetical protein PWR32_761, partial [Candidatus Woesearchaeota archaeon]|nr:hypothetical protein [Candidatus Woesearchaeota archaeon]
MNSFPSSQDINKRKVFFIIGILVLIVIYSKIPYALSSATPTDPGGSGCDPPCGDCETCELAIDENTWDIHYFCVYQCSGDEICYKGSCCALPSCDGVECGSVSACGITVNCGGCPPYKECDGDILKEYSAGNCFSNTCSYFPPKETNCNNLDGWYCNGNTREYRDYYCDDSERDCKYRVDESYNCQERYGINYMCNSTIGDCQCVPEDKEEVGAECGPDGCNPTGFGFCSYTQECIGNSCLDKKDPKTIVGYLEITGVNDKELKANLLPSDYNQKATASAYCSKFNELFQDNSCKNKEYDECGWMPGNDDVVNFYINNYELNDQSITVTCNQKGIIDGSCDGTKDFEVKFTLCDRNSDVDCVPGDYYIDVSKLGLDLDCVYVDEIEKGFESGYCHSNNELVLRAINNYKPCDPEDSNKVCIMGRCTYYKCKHNGKIDPYESCDPIDPNQYNISGTIYSQEDMSCAYLWMKPIDTGSTPSCSKTCIINTSNCGELSEYCYNHKIEDKTEYKEVCDFLEEPEYLRTLSNENIEIDSIFSGKHYCAEKEGYIGDASKLKCVGCLGISYENCDEEAKDETEKRENDCNDNLNDDYWYDLYVPVGNDRTQYIADNYLDENGYFSDFKFDTSQCYNET